MSASSESRPVTASPAYDAVTSAAAMAAGGTVSVPLRAWPTFRAVPVATC
ncbi:hypothetical protein [Streptomyces clavifer]